MIMPLHFSANIITILLVFSQAFVALCDTEILILHSNDARGRFDEISRATGGYCTKVLKKEYQCIGGLSRVAAIIRAHKKAYEQGTGPKTLYFYAGNIFTGSIWFRLFKAEISAAFMNLLQPDAVNIGNTEFNYDAALMGDYVSRLKVPVVSTNYDTRGEPLLQNVKRYVKIVVGPLTIGVMGYVEQRVQTWTHWKVNLGGKEAIVRAARELHAQGAQFIILMSSDDYEQDLDFARTVPHLDLVIGAGGDTMLWNRDEEPPPEAVDVNGTYPVVVRAEAAGHGKRYVVRTRPDSKYLGSLRLTITSKGVVTKFAGKPMYLLADLPEDQETAALLNTYRPKVVEEEKVVLATSKTYLEGNFHRCSIGECNMGSLICDAYVSYMADHWPAYPNWSYVSVCLLNAESMQSDVDPQLHDYKVTRMQLMEMRPFDDTLCVVSLRGDQLLEVLRLGAESSEHWGYLGDFLQVSGVHMTIDRSAPPGRMVGGVRVLSANCLVPRFEPLDLGRSYNVVTSRHVADGHWGDGLFRRLKPIQLRYVHEADMTVIASYLSKRSIIYPQTDGRIRFLQSMKKQSTGHAHSRSSIVVVALFLYVLAL